MICNQIQNLARVIKGVHVWFTYLEYVYINIYIYNILLFIYICIYIFLHTNLWVSTTASNIYIYICFVWTWIFLDSRTTQYFLIPHFPPSFHPPPTLLDLKAVQRGGRRHGRRRRRRHQGAKGASSDSQARAEDDAGDGRGAGARRGALKPRGPLIGVFEPQSYPFIKGHWYGGYNGYNSTYN